MKKRSTLYVCLFAALASTAQATTITITIYGTVASGMDKSSVFGTGCTSLHPCDLTGDTFELVYTFDDTKGVEHLALSGGSPNSTNITQATSTNNPGTALLTIPVGGNSFQFAAPGRSTISSLAKSVLTSDEYSISASDLGASIGGNLFPSSGSFGNGWDWRQSFSYTGTFAAGTLNGSINEGSQIVSSISLTPSTSGGTLPFSVSGQSCSTAPTLTIDATSSGNNPNILLSGETTTLNITGAASTSVALVSANSFGTFPASVTTDGSGNATATYTGGSGVHSDTLTAFSCGATAPLLDADSNDTDIYNVNLVDTNNSHNWTFTWHQSQLATTDFTTSTALSQANIQTIFADSGMDPYTHLSFLRNFYFDPTPGNGGWYDSAGTGATTEHYTASASQTAYCPTTGHCPSASGSGDLGTLASQQIYNVAQTYGINPKLILITLQKEQSLLSATSLPSTGVLNAAMGCTASDFGDQLTCGTNNTWKSNFTTNSGKSYSPMPPFFPANYINPNQATQYPYLSGANCRGNTLTTGCDSVGFTISDAATYTMFNYTPFIATGFPISSYIGGYAQMQDLWLQFSAHGWYQ